MYGRIQTPWIKRQNQPPNVHVLFAKKDKELEILLQVVRI